MQVINSLVAIPVLSLMLAGTAAMASEDKFPAYNFQPSVIFSNPELIEKTSSLGAAGAVTPAATVQAAAPAAMADPKYPAAYFTPSLIYPTK